MMSARLRDVNNFRKFPDAVGPMEALAGVLTCNDVSAAPGVVRDRTGRRLSGCPEVFR
jgi:hypothetical protein